MIPRLLSAFACCLVALVGGKAAAEQTVALELVLAVDTSASVDGGEYDLQMQGIAWAFRDPGVVAAIRRAGPGGVAVMLFHWAGPRDQSIAAGWTRVHDKLSAAQFALRVEAAGRAFRGPTSLGYMLRYAVTLFAANGYAGRRRVIDVSGDGRDNSGYDPDWMRDAAAAAGITVNGLAILSEGTDLDAYYRDHLIGGPEAFLITAAGYEDFARAIRAKLLREITGAPIALRRP